MSEPFSFVSLNNAVLTWFKSTVTSFIEFSPRTWNNFYMEDTFSFSAIAELFDRTDLNAALTAGESKKSKKASAASDRIAVDYIVSTHKCFALRHRTRIQYIMNDLCQKGARLQTSVQYSNARYTGLQAELQKEDSGGNSGD